METTPAFATEFPETIARLSESDEGRLWAESMVKLVNQQREQLENLLRASASYNEST